MSLESIRVTWLSPQDCHDCKIKPGELHLPGCDAEQCPECGWQLIGCGCYGEVDPEDEFRKPIGLWPDDSIRIKYPGYSYGMLDAIEQGYFCKWIESATKWQKCGPDDPEAMPDVSMLHPMKNGNVLWNKTLKRFCTKVINAGQYGKARISAYLIDSQSVHFGPPIDLSHISKAFEEESKRFNFTPDKKAIVVCPGPGCTFDGSGVKHGPECKNR